MCRCERVIFVFIRVVCVCVGSECILFWVACCSPNSTEAVRDSLPPPEPKKMYGIGTRTYRMPVSICRWSNCWQDAAGGMCVRRRRQTGSSGAAFSRKLTTPGKSLNPCQCRAHPQASSLCALTHWPPVVPQGAAQELQQHACGEHCC